MAISSGLGAAVVAARVLPPLARHWWVFLVRGLVAIAFGVVAFFYPVATLYTFILFYAVFSIVDGVFALVSAVRGHEGPSARWWLALIGVLGVVAGLAAYLWPGLTALALLTLIGIWALVTAWSRSSARSACERKSTTNGCCWSTASSRACSVSSCSPAPVPGPWPWSGSSPRSRWRRASCSSSCHSGSKGSQPRPEPAPPLRRLPAIAAVGENARSPAGASHLASRSRGARPSLDEIARDKLEALERRHLRRRLVVTARPSATAATQSAAELVSFSCNDYLGLSKHPD